MFHSRKHLLLEKSHAHAWLSLLINIKSCYKWNGLIRWLFCWLLLPTSKNLSKEKRYTDDIQYITLCYKQNGPKVNCLAGFCHHRLVTTSVHMHAYCYTLYESGLKTGLWTIALCRKDMRSTVSWTQRTTVITLFLKW